MSCVKHRLPIAVAAGHVVLCLSSIDSNSAAIIRETERTADPRGMAVELRDAWMTHSNEALEWGPGMK